MFITTETVRGCHSFLRPKQKYIDDYDRLSEKQKQRFLHSKIIDRKSFYAMLNLFRMRNMGFKQYFKSAAAKNPILQEIFMFRVMARIVLFLHFHKLKLEYIGEIAGKGFTPKGVYFRYLVLHNEDAKEGA